MHRIYLALSLLVWIPYGLYLLFSPDALEAIAGVSATSAAGRTELRAMYGGLEIAIGLLCLAGLLRARIAQQVLATIALLCAGLAAGRAIGLAFDTGAFGAYNGGALGFELFAAATAAWLAARAPDTMD